MAIPSTAPHRRRPSAGPCRNLPPAAIGSRPARELFATLGGLFLGPASRAGTAVEVPGILRKAQKEPARRTVPPPPRRAVLQPRFRESALRRHACRGKLWTSVRGTVRHPLGGLRFRLGLDVEFPTCRPGSHAPDQVPDSVTDIDRHGSKDPPRAMMPPASLVDLTMASSAPGRGVRYAVLQRRRGTVNLIG